jgi:hypothetical protein
MSGFLEKFNMDDVFLRGVLISFIRSLNEKLTYLQVNDQQQVLEVYVPFFFSLGGGESFLQDFYIEYKNCLTDEIHAEGNYDVIPRGIVNFTSSEINVAALTNKYTRMTYTKEDSKGEMKAYSSYVNSIPLGISLSISIKTDTLLDAFKMYQSVIQTFYKTYSFSFDHEGIRIPCQVGFPDSYEMVKISEFTYGTTPQFVEFNFSVNIETYLPDKDLTTERFRGNLMQAGIKFNQVLSQRALKGSNDIIL